MALSQVYTAVAGHTITADRWNTEFGNILNNGTDVAFPLTKAVSFAGYTITWDAASVTTIASSSSQAWQMTPGAKSGTPSTTGGLINVVASTYTDNNTSGSGTATAWAAHAIQRPTLAATNASVATTDAATLYIANAPANGTNETITNPYALWVDAGNIRLDGGIALQDSRTATAATPLTVIATTTGTPAAGIGVGILFQAESADENPSNFGQIEFDASDIDAGSEDTYFQVLLRSAGAALSPSYRFGATGATPSTAIFTHSNASARTYTLPNRSGTVGVTLGTEVASTSGTSIDFTGIPAGTRRITIMLELVSTNGTDNWLIQIGDTEGVEVTGYVGAAALLDNAASVTSANSTAGMLIGSNGSAATVMNGIVTLTLKNVSNFDWTMQAILAYSNAATVSVSAAAKSLTAELDRVRITTTGGTNTFDAGTINVSYEM